MSVFLKNCSVIERLRTRVTQVLIDANFFRTFRILNVPMPPEGNPSRIADETNMKETIKGKTGDFLYFNKKEK